MKKAGLLIVCAVMALTGCRLDMGNWGNDIIDASDNIVTTEYKLPAFEEVVMHCVGNVELIQSDSKNGVVELTAPDNYIELYQFESKDGKLDISFTRNKINIHTKDVKIKVYTTDLIRVHNSGAATISMDSLDTDQLELTNSGVGTFRMHHILANDVTVRCSGVGDISIDGQSDNVELNCSGVGSIHAAELKSLNADAVVSGVGSIECYATEKIDGKVSGVGSLKYGGHPKYKNTSHPGAGSVKEM